MRSSLGVLLFGLAISPLNAFAESGAVGFPSTVEIETGDTWTYQGQKYRLYGVQACIRGSDFVAPDGRRSDCGAHSIAPLAALFTTETVSCQMVGRARDGANFVVCAATVNRTVVDVGTALISSGAAFAATYPSGSAVSQAYLIAETTAKMNRDGLWSGTFEHPVKMLLQRR